jgi:hypothetical protein
MDLVDGRDPMRYEQFLRHFRVSKVGVRATGAPPGTTGDFKSSKDHPIGVHTSLDPQGRSVLLALADPVAFAQRFGRQFNAEMLGEALFETVLISPNCHGIRVNSAKREISIIIGRGTVLRLKSKTSEPDRPPRAPWWKLW